MHTRPDWRELPGGDHVQLQRWAVWLRHLGLRVEISDAASPDLKGIDLVHLNNLGRAFALWPTVVHCRRAGVPTLLTTLYWPVAEFDRQGRPGWAGRLLGALPQGLRDRAKAAVRWARQPGRRSGLAWEMWLGTRGLARRVAAAVDGLIAVSRAEVGELRRLLPDAPPIHVVPSGVDAFYWSDDPGLWSLEQGHAVPPRAADPTASRQGILCVARFDPQKGQHRLIEALRPLGVPLTLVGADNPNYPGYRALCQQLAGPRVTILGRQDQGRLKWLFQHCQIHALCSWYELSGLSALEAGACGARVVTTGRGGMRDYCEELAWYADPADLDSIRAAVSGALQARATPDLAGHVRRRFTWEQSARQLCQVYEATLAGRAARAA
jgi:glycosyltransferase involved in cell wall biosynthesis